MPTPSTSKSEKTTVALLRQEGIGFKKILLTAAVSSLITAIVSVGITVPVTLHFSETYARRLGPKDELKARAPQAENMLPAKASSVMPQVSPSLHSKRQAIPASSLDVGRHQPVPSSQSFPPPVSAATVNTAHPESTTISSLFEAEVVVENFGTRTAIKPRVSVSAPEKDIEIEYVSFRTDPLGWEHLVKVTVEERSPPDLISVHIVGINEIQPSHKIILKYIVRSARYFPKVQLLVKATADDYKDILHPTSRSLPAREPIALSQWTSLPLDAAQSIGHSGDSAGTPYVAFKAGWLTITTGPTVVAGGPAGNFLRLATMPATNLNTITFNRSDGASDLVIIESDFRMIPPAVGRTLAADGIGMAFLDTATHDSGGFVFSDPLEPTAINGEDQIDLASGQFFHAKIVLRPGEGFSDVSVILTPRSGGLAAHHDVNNVSVQYSATASTPGPFIQYLKNGAKLISYTPTNFNPNRYADGSLILKPSSASITQDLQAHGTLAVSSLEAAVPPDLSSSIRVGVTLGGAEQAFGAAQVGVMGGAGPAAQTVQMTTVPAMPGKIYLRSHCGSTFYYLMTGVPSGNDKQASMNWGANLNATYDLTGATQLDFIARGREFVPHANAKDGGISERHEEPVIVQVLSSGGGRLRVTSKPKTMTPRLPAGKCGEDSPLRVKVLSDGGAQLRVKSAVR